MVETRREELTSNKNGSYRVGCYMGGHFMKCEGTNSPPFWIS